VSGGDEVCSEEDEAGEFTGEITDGSGLRDRIECPASCRKDSSLTIGTFPDSLGSNCRPSPASATRLGRAEIPNIPELLLAVSEL
jgi:hypothetical protein